MLTSLPHVLIGLVWPVGYSYCVDLRIAVPVLQGDLFCVLSTLFEFLSEVHDWNSPFAVLLHVTMIHTLCQGLFLIS